MINKIRPTGSAPCADEKKRKMNHTHMMDTGTDMDHAMDHTMPGEMTDNSTGGDHSMHDMMGMHSMMMMMFFHFSKNIPSLLFESWSIQTNAELVGAIFFSLGVAVLYEALKTLKDRVSKISNKYIYLPKSKNCELNSEMRTLVRHRRYKLWITRIALAVLRTVEIGLAYILMLLAMTYNAWLFLSVCVGVGIGFFIFLPFRPVSSSEEECCG